MTNKRTYILYGIVFFVSVVLFAYYLFPGDRIKTHIEIAFEKNYPNYRLNIHTVRPALPLGLKLTEPRIEINEENTFEAAELSISYRLFSVFGAGQYYALKTKAYDGTIKGIVHFPKTAPDKFSAELHLDDIDVGEIKVVQEKSDERLIGRLSGDITYDAARPKDQAVFDLQLAECKIPLIISFLNLGVIDFDEIRMNAALTRQNLEISNCLLTGEQGDGEITGRITLSDDINQSRLNLAGTIKPNPEFLQTLPQNIIPPNMITQKGIAFKVLGTIEKPSFSLR